MGVGEFLDHALLQRRMRGRQENVLRVTVSVRHLRGLLGDDVQVDRDRLSLVHVAFILAGPAERLGTGPSLQAGEIDFALGEDGPMLIGKILADHAH